MSETTLNPDTDIWEAMRIDDVGKSARHFTELCGDQESVSVALGDNERLILSHEADPGITGFGVLLAIHQFGEGRRPDKKAPSQEERFVLDSDGMRVIGYANYDWATYSSLGETLLDLGLQGTERPLSTAEQATMADAQNARADIKSGTAEHFLPVGEFDDIEQSNLARCLSNLLHRAAIAQKILRGEEEHNNHRAA